jgi:2-polyprenyl-3-methyl-5-hydroxy-6-metoxy-1,4-benzoquinol methylase
MSLTEQFVEYFRTEAAAFSHEIERARKSDPLLFDDMAEYLISIAKRQLGEAYLDILIEGYCTFVMDVNRSQEKYEKTGKYENSSYKEVFQRTYNDTDFMNQYHWGVFVTTFAWEHHLNIYRMFRNDFLPLIRGGDSVSLLDLGCGSGVWHLLGLKQNPNLAVTAVDISETSISLSRQMAEAAGYDRLINYLCADAVDFSQESRYDTAISCFLLEHLEEPQLLLQTLSDALHERSYAFITCALTAAEIDHIFEYKYEHEVFQMAYEAGFRIVKSLSSSPGSFPRERYYLPRSLAMVVQKRANPVW